MRISRIGHERENCWMAHVISDSDFTLKSPFIGLDQRLDRDESVCFRVLSLTHLRYTSNNDCPRRTKPGFNGVQTRRWVFDRKAFDNDCRLIVQLFRKEGSTNEVTNDELSSRRRTDQVEVVRIPNVKHGECLCKNPIPASLKVVFTVDS